MLVADYGRGLTARRRRCATLLAAAAPRMPVVWDPHPRGGRPGAAVPRWSRRTRPRPARGCERAAGGDIAAGVPARRGELVARWQARAVAVTLGAARRGAVARRRRAAGVPAAGRPVAATLRRRRLLRRDARRSRWPTGAAERGGGRAPSPRRPSSSRPAGSRRDAWTPAPRRRAAAGRLTSSAIARRGAARGRDGRGDRRLLRPAARRPHRHARGRPRSATAWSCCLNSDDSVRRLKGERRPLQTAAGPRAGCCARCVRRRGRRLRRGHARAGAAPAPARPLGQGRRLRRRELPEAELVRSGAARS